MEHDLDVKHGLNGARRKEQAPGQNQGEKREEELREGKLREGKTTGEEKERKEAGNRKGCRRRVGTVNCHVRVEMNMRQLVQMVREVVQMDVCVVTETWLKGEETEMVRWLCKESGFDWVSAERSGKQGGGIGMMLKEDLRWEMVKSEGDRVMWVHVDGIGYIGAVYLPPAGGGFKTAEFHRIVTKVAQDAKEFAKHSLVVVTGDFNARMGELKNEVDIGRVGERRSMDKTVDNRGRSLMRKMNRAGLYLANGVEEEASWTFEQPDGRGRSIIDLMWLSQEAEGALEEWSEASGGMSDHAMVAIWVKGYATEVKKVKRKAKWRRVNEEWRIQGAERWRVWREEEETQRSATELWRKWRKKFEEEAIDIIGKEKQRMKKHHKGEWSEEVKQLVEMKGKLRRSGKSEREVRREIRRVKKRLNRSARQRRNDWLQEERRKNPRQYWFRLNQMMGKQKRGMPSAITYEGKELKETEKLKAWGKMFQSDQMQKVSEEVERWIRARNVESWGWTTTEHVQGLDEEIQWSEVKMVIKRLRSGKAPGEDGITAELLKGVNEECIRALWRVCAMCFEREEVPEEWARGMIVPIPKNAEVRKIENYRGITLLSIVGKAFVAVLNERMRRWMEKVDVVVEEQAGFRAGYSPVDQVYVLSEIIQRQKKRKKAYYCAFLDIKRAYDVVWREALWERLWQSGIRGKLWRMVQKLYAKTESCVLVEDQKTEWSKGQAGVRQGCVMSPNLFSLFINGMAQKVKEKGQGIRWAEKKLCLLLFADDVVLLAESERDLEGMMEEAYRYSEKWRFQFNAQKCKVMASRKRAEGEWKIGNEKVAEVQSFVYLGVEFGKRVGWKEMKERVLGKMEGRIKKVELVSKTYGVGTREVLRIWETIGRPAMEYGAEVWAGGYWKEGERVMMRLGKGLIGMRRNTNHEVVQGELGLWRMKGRWDVSRLRLWRKLVGGRNALAVWVYRQRREEFEAEGRRDKGNWCWHTWQVLKGIDRELEWEIEYMGGARWLQELKEDIGKREEKEWQARVAAKPRLRSYRLIKEKLEFENYLDCTSGKQRKALVEMRSGANDLEVEMGRRRQEEVKNRMCRECKGGVEDEMHLVLECPAYQAIRQELFGKLRDAGIQIQEGTREEKWKSLMSGPGKRRWRVIGRGVAKMLDEREKRKRQRGEMAAC